MIELLPGRNVLVTGASSGIGRAFAVEFARLGLNVILVARREDRLSALKVEIESIYEAKAYVLPMDLVRPGACERIINYLNENKLSVDVLVNNAGFGNYTVFGETKLERELDSITLNCLVPVELTHRLLPQLKASSCGAVIILSSLIAQLPGPHFATYSATKAFDLLYGEALYEELKNQGVAVLTVQPGLTRTEFSDVAGLGLKMLPNRSAEDVVKTALGALGKRTVVVDGMMNKCLSVICHLLPRFVVRRIVSLVMSKP